MQFMDWWRQVNDAGREQLLYGLARAWFAERITPARQLENLESSQEERSYYDA
jgi:hypothetical protein